MTSPALVEHFFRREYGALVAVLTRRSGARHLEAVEDAVQSALLTALEVWTRADPPENPRAWLFRVASNNLVGVIRQRTRRLRILERRMREMAPAVDTGMPSTTEIRDDTLRMLFACCDPHIPLESRIVLALKTLCGFDIREIAARLFISVEHAYKRLGRARARLRGIPGSLGDLDTSRSAERLGSVHQVLYLLFTEGHLSSHPQRAIRRELCDEAIRLTTLLTEHDSGRAPQTFALLALMHLHRARAPAREDSAGSLILLVEQDRSSWDPEEIRVGLEWLERSAAGERFTRYHAEAGIAAEHCLAPSLAETRWDRVVDYYTRLEAMEPSSLHRLNRAVALAEWRGPREGLGLLRGYQPPRWLAGSYLWHSVLADLSLRSGESSVGERHAGEALRLAPTDRVRALLRRRLAGAGLRGPNRGILVS